MLLLVAAAFLHFVLVEMRSLLTFTSTAIYIVQKGASYTYKVLNFTLDDMCFQGCTIHKAAQDLESLIVQASWSLQKSFYARTDCAVVEYNNTNYGTFTLVLCILVMVAAVLTCAAIFVVEARSVKNLEMFSGAYFVFTLKLERNKVYKTMIRALLCLFVAGPVACLGLVMYVVRDSDPFAVGLNLVWSQITGVALFCVSLYSLLKPVDDTEFYIWNEGMLCDVSFRRNWHTILSSGNDALYRKIICAGLEAGRGNRAPLEALCDGPASAQKLFEAMGLQQHQQQQQQQQQQQPQL